MANQYTIRPGDTLTSIAKANNTTVQELQSLNQIKDINRIQAGATLRLNSNPTGSNVGAQTGMTDPRSSQTGATAQTPGQFGIVNTTPTTTTSPTATTAGTMMSGVKDMNIPAQAVGTSTGMVIPTSKAPDNAIGTLVGSERASTDQNIELERLRAESTNLESNIRGLLTEMEGEEGFRQQQAQNLGLADMEKSIQEQRSIVTQLRNAFMKEYFDAEGKPIPIEDIRGEQEVIRRNRLLEIDTANAVLDTLQGNYQLAEMSLNRAVEAKYKPLQTRLNNQMFFYELNEGKFNKEEQRIAAQRKEEIQLQKDILKKQEEDEKEARDLALKALDKGAPVSVVNRLLAMPNLSINDVINTTGAYLRKQPESSPMDKRVTYGGLTTTRGAIEALRQSLRDTAFRTLEDGTAPDRVFVDPFEYRDALEAWLDSQGTVDGFVKEFPPNQMLNPNSTRLTYPQASGELAGKPVIPKYIAELIKQPKDTGRSTGLSTSTPSNTTP